METKAEWLLVHTAQNDAEAMVVRSLLEDSGIKTRTMKESIGRIEAINVAGLGEVKIFVSKDDFTEASDIMASFSSLK